MNEIKRYGEESVIETSSNKIIEAKSDESLIYYGGLEVSTDGDC